MSAKRALPSLAVAVLLAAAFAGGWLVARQQGIRAQAVLRDSVGVLTTTLTTATGQAAAQAADVKALADSAAGLLLRLDRRRPNTRSTPGHPDQKPAPSDAVLLIAPVGPVAATDTQPEAGAESPAADTAAALAACSRLARDCAALAVRVTDLDTLARRQATKIDSLLANPGPPAVPSIDLGGFKTGVVVGVAGSAVVVLTLVLLFGR